MEAASVLGMIIGGTIGLLIGGLIGAIILRAAAKWVLKQDIEFGNAFVTVVLAFLAQGALGFVIGLVITVMSGNPEPAGIVAQGIAMPLGFLVYSGIVQTRLRTASFGQACLVTLACAAIGLGIALVVGLVFGVSMLLN